MCLNYSGSKVEAKESETLTQEDLEKDVCLSMKSVKHTHAYYTTQVNISLKETDTMWMLDIPGTWVARDSEEANTVIESNIKYREVNFINCIHPNCTFVHMIV